MLEKYPEFEKVIKSVIACGQQERVFEGEKDSLKLKKLLQTLMEVEKFYEPIGGIVGYHRTFCKLLKEEKKCGDRTYEKPQGVDITEENDEVRRAIRLGIEALPEMAELYPVGGAGDRLNLRDGDTPMAAAELLFEGHTLMEGILRDLQAKEYLYWKLYGKKISIPIALMTSHEKNNHARITALFEENNWFGRDRKKVFFFTQPSVPVISEKGEWVMEAPLELKLKPGGHGVIWKLAKERGIFDQLKKNGAKKLVVRQINNPLAGCDYGLLAFTGIGVRDKKEFGFASCFRLLNTAEGMLAEIHEDDRTYIGNIEYTEFQKHGIEDVPEREGSPYSAFPANTNILFAAIEAIEKAVTMVPFPGMLINMKGKKMGRLETSMQNISEVLDTFLTFNDRIKTISVTKKMWDGKGSFVETAEGAFLDHQKNFREHLIEDCGIALPSSEVLILIHPALGPLYSVIQQKLRGGKWAKGAECVLEIAELDIQNLTLEGSLAIESKTLEGKCELHNVEVKGSLRIEIEGDGEFFAKDAIFSGPYKVEVRAKHLVTAYMKGGNVHFRTEKIIAPTWSWSYEFDNSDRIILKKIYSV